VISHAPRGAVVVTSRVDGLSLYNRMHCNGIPLFTKTGVAGGLRRVSFTHDSDTHKKKRGDKQEDAK
jgi:hypothetical protein